jgi:hypothetical protein
MSVPRTTVMRLRKRAHELRVPLAVVVNEILAAQTASIELTSKHYDEIAKATKLAEQTGKRLATHYPSST